MKLIQVFNRYREVGGEEKSAERIFQHGSEVADITKLWWKSADWDKPTGPSLVGQLRRTFNNPDTAKELEASILKFSPDALLCHNLYPVASPSVYSVARKMEIPVIQYIHNFRPFSVGANLWAGDRIAEESLHGDFRSEILQGAWQNSVLRSLVMGAVLKSLSWRGLIGSVRGWIAISEFMRLKFIEAGIEEDRVVTLRHSWDLSEPTLGAKEEDYYLCLSRLVPEKGVRTLLDAWKVLEETLRGNCPRLVIGGSGSEEGIVQAAAENSGKIDFLGFVDGRLKRELIEGCRAMIAPSIWWEPLGLVTYEAYDCGRPMIASSSGGLTETVEHGETGWLFEPGKAAELANAVIECEDCGRDQRSDMGLAGRKWLKENACPEKWKISFKEILEKFA